jgi:hypothetical protein
MDVAQAILALLTAAPQAIAAIQTIYTTVKDTLSSDDQATIDAALAAEQAKLASEQAATDAALEQAAKS